ncbi:MAG: cupredoxin domain-containing protein [Thermoplasmatota archaeon]
MIFAVTTVVAAGANENVNVVNYAFQDSMTNGPATLAHAGDTVVFHFTQGCHTASADSGATFQSPVTCTGGNFTVVIPAGATVIVYQCNIHPEMRGVIYVR